MSNLLVYMHHDCRSLSTLQNQRELWGTLSCDVPSVSNIQKSPSELKAFDFSQKTPNTSQNQTQRENVKDPVKIRKKKRKLTWKESVAGRSKSYKSEQLNSEAMLLSLKRKLQELQCLEWQFCCCGVKFEVCFTVSFLKILLCALKSTKYGTSVFPSIWVFIRSFFMVSLLWSEKEEL